VKRSDVQGVVFDLDGTLCRYEVGIAEALAESLALAGKPRELFGPLEHVVARIDRLWREYEAQRESAAAICFRTFETLLREAGSPSNVLASTLSGTYSSIRLASVALYPGTRESLADLRPRYRLGLLTNGPSDLQWSKIRRLSIESLFDAIIVAGDIGHYKPDARAFRWVAKQLELPSEQIMFVGDSLSADIAGACAAGFYSAWIRSPEAENIPETPADFVIDDLRQLRKVLL